MYQLQVPNSRRDIQKSVLIVPKKYVNFPALLEPQAARKRMSPGLENRAEFFLLLCLYLQKHIRSSSVSDWFKNGEVVAHLLHLCSSVHSIFFFVNTKIQSYKEYSQ